MARLTYRDGHEHLGIRWNGEAGPGKGHPQSRSHPTWFELPDELAGIIREQVEQMNFTEGYRAMAADRERKAEAIEWCEGLAGDTADQEA